MSTIDHDEVMNLVAAYALDALDADERAAVERHLAGCAECRSLLSGHREAAAGLAPEVQPAPELWDRIAGHLGPRVAPIDARRRPTPPRTWMAALAAAAALVLGIGVGQWLESDSEPSVGELAAQARDAEGTTVLTLVDADGRPAADAVLTADGRGYLTNRGLAGLDAGRGYQLWALRDGQPVSVALLGATPEVEAFRVPSRFDRLLVTEEPAVGSPAPTADPVASATA